MSVNAWLRRVPEAEWANDHADGTLLGVDDSRRFCIDKLECEVLVAMVHLQELGVVPQDLSLDWLDGEPLEPSLLIMRSPNIERVRSNLQPLHDWLSTSFEASMLGLISPDEPIPWWDDPTTAEGVGAHVADSMRRYNEFLAAAAAEQDVVLVSVG